MRNQNETETFHWKSQHAAVHDACQLLARDIQEQNIKKSFAIIVAVAVGSAPVCYVRCGMPRFVLSIKCIFIIIQKIASDFRRSASHVFGFRHEIYEWGIAFATKENIIFSDALRSGGVTLSCRSLNPFF